MLIPLMRLPKKLNVAAPMKIATKNRRRSAPPMVSGLLIDLYTRWVFGSSGIGVPSCRLVIQPLGEQPGHEVHCGDRHANSKDDSRQRTLRVPFSEREHNSTQDNGDQTESTGDRPRERCPKDLDGVFPRRIRINRNHCGSDDQRDQQSKQPMSHQAPGLAAVKCSLYFESWHRETSLNAYGSVCEMVS